MTNKEHLAILRQGVEVWNEWRTNNREVRPDLRKAFFIGANLPEIDLWGANLSGANLSGVDLSEADLSGANLSEADLSGANLSGVDLSGVDLSGANLSGANLSGVDLSGLDLSGANLSGVDLSGLDLSGANLPEIDLSGADLSEANLWGADLSGADLSEANLSGADLSEANLSGANLSEANLWGADLSGANLWGADLSGANLWGVDLSGLDLSGLDLSGANLWGVDLSGLDLSGLDLSGADLSGATLSGATLSGATLWGATLSGLDLSGLDLSGLDLSGADLSGADLSGATLVRVQALDTNFERATFTGVCLEDWHTNSRTRLDGVVCDYIYLKEPDKERRPHSGNFAPGEFTKLFQKALETVDLIFSNGIDWTAFLTSYQNLQIQCGGDELSIQAIENKNDGTFVIRVNVPTDANKEEIEKYIKREYEIELKAINEKYRDKLQAKDEQLADYRQHNTDLTEIVKLLASRPINIEAKAVAENKSENVTNEVQMNFHAPVTGAAGKVETMNIYTPEQRQTLAEAAAEIQQLLKQLEENNPTATEAEKKSYITAAIPKTRRERFLSALQACGKAAIEEFLDNPYVNVAIATIEGWQEGE